jgi:hypothetical protein
VNVPPMSAPTRGEPAPRVEAGSAGMLDIVR